MFSFDGSCWLCPGEQEEAIAMGIEAGMLTWDNTRKLKLKMGGFTDIYENLRLTRSNPRALRYFAELFANPLRRLRVDRFVEVPEAVSPLAGVISDITGIPLVTVREEAKEDRVVSGNLVGDLKRGERVAIIDNVITNGESKIVPIKTVRERGAEVVAQVVLVDRQQGWKQKLAEVGLSDVGVWPGFTLHDVRKYLVGHGLMRRCDPAVEAKNPLIMALDGLGWDAALPILDQLRTTGCIFKANDLLLNEGFKNLMPNLSVYGRAMIDFKGHDIGNTLVNDCNHLRVNPPWAITIHASGGTDMIAATVKAMTGTPTIILTVTLLTSISNECETIYGRLPSEQVKVLAKLAWEAGARGFVCSGKEAPVLRALYPEATIVVPALRSPKPGEEKAVMDDDQKRTSTFAGARDAGANFLVGGRQFLQSKDPVAEVQRVLKDELNIR